MFVKFDKSYAYGPKEDAFVEFANLAANEGDLLVCAVAVSRKHTLTVMLCDKVVFRPFASSFQLQGLYEDT